MLARGTMPGTAASSCSAPTASWKNSASTPPEMLVAAEKAMRAASHDGKRICPDESEFSACPSDSIDYAVMERADRVAVVPVAMGWNDVGSWDALHAISELDGFGNAHRGEVLAIDTKNCLIRTDRVRVAAVDVQDLIVVASGERHPDPAARPQPGREEADRGDEALIPMTGPPIERPGQSVTASISSIVACSHAVPGQPVEYRIPQPIEQRPVPCGRGHRACAPAPASASGRKRSAAARHRPRARSIPASASPIPNPLGRQRNAVEQSCPCQHTPPMRPAPGLRYSSDPPCRSKPV